MTEGDGGRVVAFAPRPVRAMTNEKEPPECAHLGVVVSRRHPELRCDSCNRLVDPYAWIRQLVSRWDSFEYAKDREARISDLIHPFLAAGGTLRLTKNGVDAILPKPVEYERRAGYIPPADGEKYGHSNRELERKEKRERRRAEMADPIRATSKGGNGPLDWMRSAIEACTSRWHMLRDAGNVRKA